MGEDVRNLTSEPPNGLNCRILVVEGKKVAVGLWPVESAMLAGNGGQPLATIKLLTSNRSKRLGDRTHG